MPISSEDHTSPEKILIVDRNNTAISVHLKNHLKKYDSDIYLSSLAPKNISPFSVCIIINGSIPLLEKMIHYSDKKIAFIYANVKDDIVYTAIQHIEAHKKNVKIIRIKNTSPSKEDIEKILWFTLTSSKEYFLNLHYINPREEIEVNKAVTKKLRRKNWGLKRLILFGLFILFILHILYIPPLIFSSYYLYKIQEPMEKENIEQVQTYINKMDKTLNISKKLYSFVRPTYLFFSIASIPENIFQLNVTGNNVIKKAIPIYYESKELITLLMKKDKTAQETEKMQVNQKKLIPEINDLHENLSFLYQKIPEWNVEIVQKKEKFKKMIELIETTKKFLPHFNTIFASNTEKKYLLMFANNMEIRPGGGFIGSFGVVDVKNLTISKITIYDVYDADGQLNAHIPPPEPIRIYLHQPHWFLRDSAFSPDFYENYLSAEKFLEKEMGFSGFDGGLLITTSTIQQILDAVGEVYLPDIQEIINKDNFYLKAQLYAEKDFFPGSIQKKSFLSEVADSLMIKLEDSPPPKLIPNLIESFNEKQAVVYFEDPDLEKFIDSLYWSGKVVSPKCSVPDNSCITDFLFPYDANLGVNKANFFITKSTSLQVLVNPEGKIKNTYKVTFNNDSPNDVFPGGTYKNYMQMLIPKDAEIIRITKNGTLIDEFDESTELYKKIGFYIEIPAQTKSDVIIEYEDKPTIKNGTNHYQLILQKQIGSPNYDFNFSMELPNNTYLVNQNFSPLVKGSTILYNTTIKADKIFFLELLKEQR